jgi:RNA-directed DNA polymerase
VVDLDLEKFFDNVDHDILMSRVRRKVKDKRVLKLIRTFLNGEVSDQGKIFKPTIGTPQGGPLSPLLSNIILDDLDKELERRGHRFVRYADDCSIFVKSEKAGVRVLTSISRFLEKKLKLRVNLHKSKVDRPHKRKLLGYSFIPSKDPMIKVAPETVQKLKASLKPIFRKGRGKKLDSFISDDLNPVLRGWANYFSLTTGKKTFVKLDMWVRRRIRNLLWRRWRSFESRFRVFKKLLPRDEAKLAALSGRGAWFNSGTKLVNAAFNLDFFKKYGLISTLDIWKSNNDYRRTALVRNRMPGGVGGR